MYIELFLLDNFIMDMLIIHLSATWQGISYSKPMSIGVCIFQAVYSAFAVNCRLMNWAILKIPLCIILTLPFIVKNKHFSWLSIACVFIATLTVGGTAFAFSLLIKSPVISKIVTVLAVVAVLRLITAVRKRAASQGYYTEIQIEHCGNSLTLPAILDSGSTLCDLVTGKPVVLVYAPELMLYADLPIFYGDTSSPGNKVYAFKPDSVRIGNSRLDVLVAPLCTNPNMKAIVPIFAVFELIRR